MGDAGVSGESDLQLTRGELRRGGRADDTGVYFSVDGEPLRQGAGGTDSDDEDVEEEEEGGG